MLSINELKEKCNEIEFNFNKDIKYIASSLGKSIKNIDKAIFKETELEFKILKKSLKSYKDNPKDFLLLLDISKCLKLKMDISFKCFMVLYYLFNAAYLYASEYKYTDLEFETADTLSFKKNEKKGVQMLSYIYTDINSEKTIKRFKALNALYTYIYIVYTQTNRFMYNINAKVENLDLAVELMSEEFINKVFTE